MSHSNSRTLNHTWYRLLLSLLITSLLLASHVPPAKASTIINGGAIIGNQTWTQVGSPYIITADLTVVENATLTIEPGVSVRFDRGVGMLVEGALIARGSADNLILFTSNQFVQVAGDWENIRFSSTAVHTTLDGNGAYLSGSILEYFALEYADGSSATDETEDSAILAYSLLIDHCILRLNRARAIYNYGTQFAPGRVSNCDIHHNNSQFPGGGIYARYNTIQYNTLSNNYSNNGGGIYAQFSTVDSNTLIYNRSSNGGGIHATSSTVTNNVLQNNSSGSGGGFYMIGGTATANTLQNNIATIQGGGVYANNGSTLNDNNITDNLSYGDGGGIYSRFSTVSNNTISNNRASNKGGGAYAYDTALIANTVSGNQVSSATSGGSGVYVFGSDLIQGNTIVNNEGPAELIIGGIEFEGSPPVYNNSLFDNSPYDAVVKTADTISGTNNYWATAVNTEIAAHIYDLNDDPARGELIFEPFLSVPSSEAPLPPPLGLSAQFTGSSATLTWEPVPGFASGWGYRLFYDIDSGLPPYGGGGLDQGSSPIDTLAQREFTLTGLSSSTDYYFAVVVYDDGGRQSWYSNVVWKRNVRRVFMPIINR